MSIRKILRNHLLQWSALLLSVLAPVCPVYSAQMPAAMGGGQMPSQMTLPEEIAGHVLNVTTGKPAAAAEITVVKPGTGGMETVRTLKTDAQGKFKLPTAKELLESPHLLQTEYQGVTYTMMLRPMASLNDLEIRVYDSTDKPQGLQFSVPHMMIQRQGDTLKIDEIYQIENPGNRTFLSREGTFRFYPPPSMSNLLGAALTAAGSTMPIQESPVKLPDGQGYKIDSPLKPGRTQIRFEYEVSYAGGRASLPRKFFYPIRIFSVAVSPEDVEVTSNLLKPSNDEVSNGFKLMNTSAIPEGQEVTIDLAGGSNPPPESPAGSSGTEQNAPEANQRLTLVPPDISRYKVLILFNLTVLMAAFLGWRLTSRDSAAADGSAAGGAKKGVSRGKLLKQREGLLDQLADLDERLEARTLSPREHQQKRPALKGQLVEVTRYLEKEPAEPSKK